MTEVSAIAALDQLEVLDELVERRQRVASVYAEAISGHPSLIPQAVRAGDRHSWVHWVVRVRPQLGRDRLAEALSRSGVATKPYYLPFETGLVREPPLTATRRLHAEVLALPMSSELDAEQAEQVAVALDRALRGQSGMEPASRHLSPAEAGTSDPPLAEAVSPTTP
jgi:dTDP-4-amino-4,6-dideoxygalactose transaminase